MKFGSKAWPLVVLSVISALCYVNSLHGDFVFDDMVIALSSGMLNIHSLHDIAASAERPEDDSVRDIWSEPVLRRCRHVRLSPGQRVPACRQRAAGLRHIVVGAATGGSRSPERAAFAGALVFGVHTLLSSAVSYIAGRSSVLCATFYFSSVLVFLKGLSASRRSSRAIYFVLTALFFGLAWWTKQEAITLPLFLACIVFFRSEKRDWRWIACLAATPLAAAFLIRKQLAAMFTSIAANEQLVNAGFGTILAAPTFLPDLHHRSRQLLSAAPGGSCPFERRSRHLSR